MFTYIKMLAVLLLPLTFVVLFYLLRGCKRLKHLRVTDVFAISFCGWSIILYVVTEVLSLFKALSYAKLLVSWLLIFIVFAIMTIKLSNKVIVEDARRILLVCNTSKKHILERIVFAALAAMMIFMAIAIAPNNYDSMVYHCTRIAHWAQNQSIAHFSSHALEPVASPFFAEYINLNVYILMVKHDHFLNLLQLFAYFFSGIYVRQIAKKLGASGIFRNLSMLLFYSMPIAFMEAFTTQVDVVSCLIFLMFLYFIMDFWNESLKVLELFDYKVKLLCIAILTGIGYITKPSICVAMAVFYFGILLQMIWRKEKILNIIKVIIFCMVVVICIMIPEFYRNLQTFGSLSPEAVGQRQLVATVHPLYLLLNFTKNFMMNLVHKLTAGNRVYLENILYFLAALLGVNADDPSIAENGSHFNLDINNPLVPKCDTAVNPLIFYCFIIAGIIFIVVKRKGRNIIPAVGRYYVGALISIAIFFTVLRWENYVTRYEISYLAMICPFIAVAIEKVIENKTYKIMASGVILFLAISDLLLLFESQIETYLIASESRERAYFLEYTDAYPPRAEMIELIEDNGYKKIGYVKQASGGIEYTIWAMLRLDDVWIENIMVNNETSKYEKADFIPDCIICIWDEDIESFEYHGNEYTRIYSGSASTNLFAKD